MTCVSVLESHDLIAAVSSISETSIQSEFNLSSHPPTNNVYSHTEPGIITYFMHSYYKNYLESLMK